MDMRFFWTYICAFPIRVLQWLFIGVGHLFLPLVFVNDIAGVLVLQLASVLSPVLSSPQASKVGEFPQNAKSNETKISLSGSPPNS